MPLRVDSALCTALDCVSDAGLAADCALRFRLAYVVDGRLVTSPEQVPRLPRFHLLSSALDRPRASMP